MFTGLHWYDLAILLALALLFFGPKRLPEMGSSIGKTIKEFQKSMREVSQPTQDASTTALPAPATPARPIEPPQAAASASASSPDSSSATAGSVPAETRPD